MPRYPRPSSPMPPRWIRPAVLRSEASRAADRAPRSRCSPPVAAPSWRWLSPHLAPGCAAIHRDYRVDPWFPESRCPRGRDGWQWEATCGLRSGCTTTIRIESPPGDHPDRSRSTPTLPARPGPHHPDAQQLPTTACYWRPLHVPRWCAGRRRRHTPRDRTRHRGASPSARMPPRRHPGAGPGRWGTAPLRHHAHRA